MRIFGLTITRAAPKATTKAAPALRPVDNRGAFWGLIKESFTGAWQQNVEVKYDTVVCNPTVFRCMGLISSDVAKMRVRLVSQDDDGIWTETTSASFSPVLRKPNRFQNRIQFFENWVLSKLSRGNTYVLKGRDSRGVVTSLYILDPNRVTPLVAPDGSVFYELQTDALAGIAETSVTVPASEIIHDRFNTLFHPLVGLSPIYACGLAAVQGIRIQSNSAAFFGNGSKPGGVLTAPGAISDETAARLKAHWDNNYSGDNVGKVAVLGDGLTYVGLAVTAVDAQLIEQLKWSSETICSCFGVPAHMAGVGAAPADNNVEARTQQYYSQCLQVLIESVELCLDEGLGLDAKKDGATYGTEFDLDDLLRMDTATQVKTLREGVVGGLVKPNEGRKKLGLKPVAGGDAVYLQQQNYSLAALNERDRNQPFEKPQPAAPANAADEDVDVAANDNAAAKLMVALITKFAGAARYA